MQTAQVRPVSSANTFAALQQSSNFRLYFVGLLLSVTGTWMQNLAEGYLVFQLTQSEAWLGVVACASGLPFLLLAPLAGVVVERIPRRRLLLMTQGTQMCLAFILAVLTFSGAIQVWHIVLLAFLLGTSNAIDMPARQTFVIELVGDDLLSSGIALNSIVNSSARVLGPMAAGVALAQLGPAWCFFLNGLSFLSVLTILAVMRVPYAIECVRSSKPLKQLREGLAFARQHTLIGPLLLLAAIGGLSMLPIIRILPAFADVVLHSPAEGYAALTAGQGIGSVLAGLTVGWLAHRLTYGRLLPIAFMLSAVGTIVMALQVEVLPAALWSALAGMSLITLFVSLNTSIQMVVPNVYRGRVLALYTLAFMGISPFAALFLGLVASAIGVSAAMTIFTLAGVVLSIYVFLRWPALTAVSRRTTHADHA